MKRNLKYLIALLMAGSIGMLFAPLIKISIVEISVMDILKAGVGKYSTVGVSGEIYPYIQEYLKSGVIFLSAWLILILAGAFMTAVLNGRKAYIIAIAGSIINNLAAVFICVYIKGKMNEVEDAVIVLDLSGLVKFLYTTIFLWILIYAVIFALSILGISLWRREDKNAEHIQTMPEEFNYGQDSWEAPVNLKERDYFNQIQIPEVENKTEDFGQRDKKPEKEIIGPGDADFGGAVTGGSGIFAGKAYLLKEREEVFLCYAEGTAFLKKNRDVQSVAGLYYISQYQEYCVDIFAQSSVFLNSGQPLGKGRKYYLSRGTGIYITNRENLFTLA